MRFALDTNVLLYAEGINGLGKRHAALRLIESLPAGDVALPVQALGELFRVLVRKAGWPPEAARSSLLSWKDLFPLVETTASAIISAADLATDHRLSIWDSIIVSATAEAGCRLLLSEDMQDGFTWRGVTVTNPFSSTPHPLLSAFLGESGAQ